MTNLCRSLFLCAASLAAHAQMAILPSQAVLELDGILRNHNGDAIIKPGGFHAVMQSPDYTRDNIIIDGVFQPRPAGGIYRGMRDMILWPNTHVQFVKLAAFTDEQHDILHLIVRSDLGAFCPISFLFEKGQLGTMSKFRLMQLMDPFIVFAAADEHTFRVDSRGIPRDTPTALHASHPPSPGCQWVPYISKKFGLQLLVEQCADRRVQYRDTSTGIGSDPRSDISNFDVLQKTPEETVEAAIQRQIIAKFTDPAARAGCRAVRQPPDEEPGWHEYGVQAFGSYAHPKPSKTDDSEKGEGLCEGMWAADVSAIFIYNPELSKTRFFVLKGLADPIKGQPYDIFSLRFQKP